VEVTASWLAVVEQTAPRLVGAEVTAGGHCYARRTVVNVQVVPLNSQLPLILKRKLYSISKTVSICICTKALYGPVFEILYCRNYCCNKNKTLSILDR